MSIVEARIALSIVGEVGLSVPSEEDLNAGADPIVELLLPIGIMMPFGVKPGEPLVTPLGILTMKMTKQEALDLFTQGADAVGKMPDPKPTNNLAIATNMDEVRARAEEIQRFARGN